VYGIALSLLLAQVAEVRKELPRVFGVLYLVGRTHLDIQQHWQTHGKTR
jgi:hypothetical protein